MQHVCGAAALGTLRWPQGSGNTAAAGKLQGCSCFLPYMGWEPAPHSQKPLAAEPSSGTATQQRLSAWGQVCCEMVTGTPRCGIMLSEEFLLLHFQLPLEIRVIPKVWHPADGTKGHTHHGKGFPGLLEQRLREQGDVHTLRDIHCPAIQVRNYNIQLEEAGQGMRQGQASLHPPHHLP